MNMSYAPLSDPSDDFETLSAMHKGCGYPVATGEKVSDMAFDPERGLAAPEGAGWIAPRGPILEGAGPSFSVGRFSDGLRDRLAGRAKGWAFAINVNGQLATAESDAGGDARSSAEGDRDMTLDTRLNIASVSKTITAVAVLRLLETTGFSVDTPIYPFLPGGWTIGPGVDTIRFRDLLRHESGLTSLNSNFNALLSDNGLRAAIAAGGQAFSPYRYLNANFALFRVIIPRLWNRAGQTAANNDNPTASAFFYALYIINELFGAMGGAIGANASTSVLDDNPTRYYNGVGSNSGIDLGNWALIAGGGGWHLSVRELAAFLANITYNDDVLSSAARAQMDAMFLGWRPLQISVGQFGIYRAHGGSIGGGGGAVRTAIVKYPFQCEVAVVANSAISGFGDAVALANTAFEAAWT